MSAAAASGWVKNDQQWPSFLRLSEAGYRAERCLFASRVTPTWLIASSPHQFTNVNNQRGKCEKLKNTRKVATSHICHADFFLQMRMEHTAIRDYLRVSDVKGPRDRWFLKDQGLLRKEGPSIYIRYFVAKLLIVATFGKAFYENHPASTKISVLLKGFQKKSVCV